MKPELSIVLGIPEHRWLPVDLRYNDFQLEFAASGILNNPVKELYNCVTKLQNKEIRRTTWWLEPMAYFIDFEKAGKNVVLTITETDDLHNGTAESIPLLRITGEEKNILTPFRLALNFFCVSL